MNNVGVIDQFLETFTRYIDSGFGLVHGDVTFLTTTLIVIDITLAGLFPRAWCDCRDGRSSLSGPSPRSAWEVP